MKRSTLASVVTILFTALSASGCMTSPYDGQEVESESSVITFSGYHVGPNLPVSIRAFETLVGEWYEIGLATSSPEVSWVAMDGTNLYYWEENLVVPSDFWESGSTGARAWVAAVSEGNELMSVNSDWLSCYLASSDLSDFSENCAAEYSPIARIYTEDYLGLAGGGEDATPINIPAPLEGTPMPWPPPIAE